jgi:3-oxoacyl-[acyl-carrier-protein] synthase-3
MKLTNNFLCLPTKQMDVAQILKFEYGRSDAEIKKIIETTGVHTFHSSKSKKLSTFVFNAATQIRDQFPDVCSGADAVIVVAQTYDMRIPSISTQLLRIFDLDASTFCLDITDGCSGLIKATRIAELLLQDGRRKVIIFAGDINSLITEAAEAATRVLFGDGFSVSIFEESNDPAKFEIFNDGEHSKHIQCETDTSIMEMNGFEVFRFTRNVVPKLVFNYFEKHSLAANDFQLFAFHQASRLVVSSLTSLLHMSNHEVVDFNCGAVGNLGSGSIGAWLALTKGLDDGQCRRMLAIGYGAGLSWGLADLFIQLNHNGVIYVED